MKVSKLEKLLKIHEKLGLSKIGVTKKSHEESKKHKKMAKFSRRKNRKC